MTDQNDKPKGGRRADRDIERVKELYKNADRMYGGFSEAEGPEPYKPEPAGKKDQRVSGIASASPESKVDAADHVWMVYVLADLAEYAKEEGLFLAHDHLKDAQQYLSEWLRLDPPHKDRLKSDLPKDEGS